MSIITLLTSFATVFGEIGVVLRRCAKSESAGLEMSCPTMVPRLRYRISSILSTCAHLLSICFRESVDSRISCPGFLAVRTHGFLVGQRAAAEHSEYSG